MSDQSSRPQTAVSWAFKAAKKEYSPTTRFVFVTLASLIESGNPCPSFKDLADITGLSKSSVQSSVETLESDSLIRRDRGNGDTVKGGVTSHYSLIGYGSVEIDTDYGIVPMSEAAEFVYLLKTAAGHFKIGCTVNLEGRLKTFATTLPISSAYECILPCENMLNTERRLHERFRDKRQSGEWFDLSPEDVEYIKRLAVQS